MNRTLIYGYKISQCLDMIIPDSGPGGRVMHAFQPYPLDFFETHPFEKFDKQWAEVVVSDGKGGANAMTVSWGAFGTIWNKPCVTLYVRESRYTHDLLENTDKLSINFFSEDYKQALKFLGTVSGRNENKIQEARLHDGLDDEIPYIDEANLLFFCRKLSATPITASQILDEDILNAQYKTGKKEGDFHTMYICEVMKAAAR